MKCFGHPELVSGQHDMKRFVYPKLVSGQHNSKRSGIILFAISFAGKI